MVNMDNIKTKYDTAKQAGVKAELDAKYYLENQGLQFIEKNFRVPQGEIDLIFKDKQQWVFVEVKYRSSSEKGFAAEYFTSSKRSKMNKAIMCYLQQHNLNLHKTSLRLDVIAIDDERLTWLDNV
jgi:putative endonuclease